MIWSRLARYDDERALSPRLLAFLYFWFEFVDYSACLLGSLPCLPH